MAMRPTSGVLLAAALAVTGASQVLAHHSFTATYDTARSVRLEGVLTRIDWVNPHAYLFLEVVDGDQPPANWAVEFGNIFDLERAGWSGETVAIGDRLRVEAYPARGTSRRAFARSVVLAATGEAVFFAPEVSSGDADPRPAPRWGDGQIRLGPEPGEKGYWGPASAPGLVEDTGIDIPMNADAILLELSDAGLVAPFQPWARALYERRQRRLLVDDPVTRCMPPGGPRQFHTPYGIQFVEQRELGRILVLLGGGNRNWRVIYTDRRPVEQRDEVVRTYYGTSVGRWEGDTLVVESVGFNERFWFTRGGLPHTERLHLTERFSRVDFRTLAYEATIDDPGAYTRPWTGRWTIEWVPDEEIQEYFCEENAESTFIR
jgi:hypothetical protein